MRKYNFDHAGPMVKTHSTCNTIKKNSRSETLVAYRRGIFSPSVALVLYCRRFFSRSIALAIIQAILLSKSAPCVGPSAGPNVGGCSFPHLESNDLGHTPPSQNQIGPNDAPNFGGSPFLYLESTGLWHTSPESECSTLTRHQTTRAFSQVPVVVGPLPP